MSTGVKNLLGLAELSPWAIHKIETASDIGFGECEDFCPGYLAAETEFVSGSAAPTIAAWNAFAAWCEATDDRYGTWTTAYKLLTRKTPAGR